MTQIWAINVKECGENTFGSVYTLLHYELNSLVRRTTRHTFISQPHIFFFFSPWYTSIEHNLLISNLNCNFLWLFYTNLCSFFRSQIGGSNKYAIYYDFYWCYYTQTHTVCVDNALVKGLWYFFSWCCEFIRISIYLHVFGSSVNCRSLLLISVLFEIPVVK